MILSSTQQQNVKKMCAYILLLIVFFFLNYKHSVYGTYSIHDLVLNFKYVNDFQESFHDKSTF